MGGIKIKKTVIFTFSLLTLAIITFAAAPYFKANNSVPIKKDEGWQLVWNDEFNAKNGSKPDAAKWSYNLGTGTDYGIPEGWGNGEMEYYTDRKENASIQNGKLAITAIKESYKGKVYTSARLVSKNKGDWTYGRFEIKARLPHGEGLQGIWPAIWMLPTESRYGNWPLSGEIDIMEMVGRDPMKVLGTLHFGLPWQHPSEYYELPTDDFHVYAIEWDASQFKFFVDEQLYGTRTKDEWYSSGGAKPAPFDQNFHLVLNLAVGGGFPGYPTTKSIFPQTFEIDYVRVYQIRQ